MDDRYGGCTDYHYDAAGRLAGIWGADGNHYGFRYDAGGRLLERWLPNGTRSEYSYNAVNQLTRLAHKNALGSTLLAYDYGYDSRGNRSRSSQSFAADTRDETYEYDGLSQLLAVKQGGVVQEAFNYDALGNRLQRTSASGVEDYEYDQLGQLKSVRRQQW